MSARPWTPESRDALLGRVTAITTGTAVVGCVGALGLAVGLAATASASPSTKAAGSTKPVTKSAAAPQTPASADAVAPADVQVEVLNGVGIAGAAHLVAQQLRDAGFDVVATGNTNGTVRASGIIYAPGQEAAFATLSKSTGVTLSSDRGSSATLVLVIGPDWQGALPAAQSQSQGNGFSQPQSPPQSRSNNGGGNATSGGS